MIGGSAEKHGHSVGEVQERCVRDFTKRDRMAGRGVTSIRDNVT
jgi:hypothetical protein